ncbi:MAG TPA: TIGR03557 family F420-dependent LLM class oxidoreductase [Acidimicrobiia bacterium]
MVEIGYALSSEEHAAPDLVRYARRAEDAGFTFALVSDHYHPWTERQGHSPFAWSVLGGVATATERLRVGTGVTCPLVRTPPALVAQAAATVAEMMPGRFFLGIGTGENLNEHITGDPWPPVSVRMEMLEEAIEVMRPLLRGELVTHRGRHFTVDNAKVYCDIEQPPPIYVAAAGEQAAELAGRAGDGLVSTAPDERAVKVFDQSGGQGRPHVGQVMVCWAGTEEEGRRIAHGWWPNAALPGQLGQELPLPAHFEQATSVLDPEDVAERVICGPDADRHAAAIDEYVEAGYEHVYVHQIGPDQDGFFDFYERAVLPRFAA